MLSQLLRISKCPIVFAVFILGCGAANLSACQTLNGLPPEPDAAYSMRAGIGVNLSTSALTISNTDISVGTGEFPSKIDFVRTYNLTGMPAIDLLPPNSYASMGNGNQSNLLVYFACQDCNNGNASTRIINVTAVVFGRAYHFTGAGPTGTNPNLTNEDDDGSTMTVLNPLQSSWVYQLITHDGVKVVFSDNPAYWYDTYGGRYAEYVEFPSGDFLTFNYEPSPNVSGSVRLKSVANSRGYGLVFSYVSGNANYLNGPTNSQGWFISDRSILSAVQAVRLSCNSSATVNCSSGILSAISYGYSNGGAYLTSFTDAGGNTTKYAYDSYNRLSAIYAPDSPNTPSVQMTYVNGVSDNVPTVNWLSQVAFPANGNGFSFNASTPSTFQYSSLASVTDHTGNKTQYNFSGPDGTNRSVVVTNPDGSTDTYFSDDYCYGQPCVPYPLLDYSPTRHIDALGRTTNFTHDLHGRLLSVTNPEGDSVTQTLDANGNITKVVYQAKPGSGLPNRTTTAQYTQCNSYNYKFCNKPINVIDARGSEWDYQYDANSGEASVELAPADATNRRAVTRTTYSAFSYVPSFLIPSGIAVPPAYHITAKDTCFTSTVTGSTIDFTQVCSVGSRRHDTYNYTTSSNSDPELGSVVEDGDSVAATTTYTYDQVGNILSINGPRTDVDETKYVTYDVLRRPVFEIGLDPDGGGPLRRQIVHHVYNVDGNEVRTEYGSGSALDGSDFVIAHFNRKTYEPGTAKLIKLEEVLP